MSSSKLVTVVHPDSRTRIALRSTLEAHGCTVATDHSCTDLMSDESGMHPSVILIDRSLLGDEGVDVLSRLSHKWEEAEVVVLPDEASREDTASTVLRVVDRLLQRLTSRELLESAG